MKDIHQFPEHLRNRFDGSNVRVAIICSRFNATITKALALGAVEACKTAGIAEEQIELHYVPGAFEVPQAAALLSRSSQYQAIVCLGAIIRGETTHHEHLAQAIFPQLMKIACDSGLAMGTGILTVDNQSQAESRIGGAHGHKGIEAACAALEMLDWQQTRK